MNVRNKRRGVNNRKALFCRVVERAFENSLTRGGRRSTIRVFFHVEAEEGNFARNLIQLSLRLISPVVSNEWMPRLFHNNACMPCSRWRQISSAVSRLVFLSRITFERRRVSCFAYSISYSFCAPSFLRYIIGSNETLSGVLLTILSATVIFIKFSSIKFIQSSNISFHVRRVSRLIDPLSLHDREPRNANCFSSSRSIGSSISRDLVENQGSTMTHGAEEIDPRPRIHSSQNIPALLHIAHVPNQIKINRPVHSNIRKIVSTDNWNYFTNRGRWNATKFLFIICHAWKLLDDQRLWRF